MQQRRPPRLLDIAREAGVSTATVDRVVHGRGGVSARTVALVRRVEASLVDHGAFRSPETERRRSATAQPCDVVLPSDAGLSTDYLAAAMRRCADKRGLSLRVLRVDRMNPAALSAALKDIALEGSAGVAFQALEHPLVIEAARSLRDLGISVTSVVSGISSSSNIRHVGLDNRGAGRTAAFLMGSFLAGAGRVALVWSGSLSRAHEERESGFRAFIRDECPAIDVSDIDIGRHEPEATRQKLMRTLDEGSFAGCYCVGAGLGSLVDAASALAGRSRPKIVGHNLTEKTLGYLVNRSVAAIIHQDMTKIAEEVIEGFCDSKRINSVTVPTIIVTRENLDQFLDLTSLRPYLDDDARSGAIRSGVPISSDH